MPIDPLTTGKAILSATNAIGETAAGLDKKNSLAGKLLGLNIIAKDIEALQKQLDHFSKEVEAHREQHTRTYNAIVTLMSRIETYEKLTKQRIESLEKDVLHRLDYIEKLYEQRLTMRDTENKFNEERLEMIARQNQNTKIGNENGKPT